MNAEQARQLANSVTSEKEKNQIYKVLDLIEKAANEGKTCINIDFSLQRSVILKLQSDGYVVGNATSFRNESNQEISWS